jgi:hypothetical protein
MNKRLDNLIQQWAKRSEPSDEHLAMLKRRIAGKLPFVQVGEGTAQSSTPSNHVLSRLAYVTLGAAAAAVVLLSMPRGKDGNEDRSAASAASAMAGISERRIEMGERLFEEMNRLFNGNLRWVAESNGDIGMGVETVESPCDAVPALVRVTVLARRGNSAVWSTAWQSDVVLRGQDLVEVAPNADTANKLALWVFPLEDGNIAVDTSLSLNLSARLATQVSTVIAPGETTELATVHGGGTEFRVFQTVVFLGQHDCAPCGVQSANGGV